MHVLTGSPMFVCRSHRMTSGRHMEGPQGAEGITPAPLPGQCNSPAPRPVQMNTYHQWPGAEYLDFINDVYRSYN